MKMSQNNFYITTPIYYPSGEPHMGHAYSSILADVFARFKRNDNYKVFFLTGTDEHGLKIQNAAEKDNLDPLIYCDKISRIFKDLAKKLNLSNVLFLWFVQEKSLGKNLQLQKKKYHITQDNIEESHLQIY